MWTSGSRVRRTTSGARPGDTALTPCSRIMHYHGPCTYPGGFMWFYRAVMAVTRSSLSRFQMLWALFEGLNFFLVRRLCVAQGAPAWTVSS